MLRHTSANIRIAKDNVKYPVGHPRFAENLRQLQTAQWCKTRRLIDQRVTAGKRHCSFPTGNLDRIVPRTNARTDPQRLPACVAKRPGEVHLMTADGSRYVGKIFDAIRPRRHVYNFRLLYRLPCIHDLQLSQLTIAITQQLHCSQKDAATLHCLHARPDLKAIPRGGHCPVEVLQVGSLDCAQNLSRCRVHGVKRLARTCTGIAADIKPLLGQLHISIQSRSYTDGTNSRRPHTSRGQASRSQSELTARPRGKRNGVRVAIGDAHNFPLRAFAFTVDRSLYSHVRSPAG